MGEGNTGSPDVLPTTGSRLENVPVKPQNGGDERFGLTSAARQGGSSSESTIEVPISEEQVKVGKRTVGAGKVKLHKTVTTEQVNVPVELKHEDIVIERVTAHEVGSAKDPFQEEQIKVPLSREEPVVDKEVRVKDGVRVQKTEGTEERTIRENIRREDIAIDESGKISPPATPENR